ncbi:MAG: hypothetical protein ABSA86_09530 [Oryzomonas sp.]|jgi:hypothetical protein
MNDPHVSTIRYRLELGNVSYVPPVDERSFTLADFDFAINGTDITVRPRIHFPDREAACAAAETHIRAWELEAGIRLCIPRLRIIYQETDIIDRAPTPGVNLLITENMRLTSTIDDAILIRHIAEYPPPPDADFVISPDVETMWQRYVGYLEGREPLLAMAYFCFTLLKGKNGCSQVAWSLNTEEQILHKLSDLSSTRGDASIGRKANLSPLTSEEHGWVDQTVRALIIQLAKSSAGPPADSLKMDDLPKLSNLAASRHIRGDL